MTNERLRLLPAGRRKRNLFLASLLTAAFSAHANGLGDIAVKSHLGERLRVEIQLRGNDGSPRGAECFHLSNALADNSGLPLLRHAAMNVLQNPPRLVITSRDAIFEPAIELAVFYGCGVYLSRSYTVLLSPREELAAPSAPTVARVDNQETSKPVAKPPRTAAERRARMLLPGETPEEMAQRLYPKSEAYRDRFLDELVALNPGKISTQTLDEALPEGAVLKIPPRFVPVKKLVPVVRDERAVEPAAPSPSPTTPSTATSPPAAADRLVLGPPEDTPGAQPPVAPELARIELDQRLRDVIGQARALSSELSSMQSEFPNPPPEIRTRLLEMETRLARMELSAVRIKLSMAQGQAEPETTPGTPTAGSEAPATPTPVASPAPVAEKPAAETPVAKAATVSEPAENSSGFWWGLGALLASAAALAAYLARNASRAGQGGPLSILMPMRRPSTATEAAAEPLPGGATGASAPMNTAGAPMIDDLDKPEAPPEFERAMPSEVEIVEVAHVLAIFGRTPSAIEVLTEFIDQNPAKALNPSLYLLKLYKQTNHPDEFATLAKKLHADFNLLAISWDDPIEGMAPIEPSARDYRDIAKELEKIPHIYSRISEQWGSRECLDYLEGLLHDNRSGERKGLPLAAANEVLNLIAMLQRQLPATAKEQ